VSRHKLLLLPALVCSLALPVAPAVAGEDDPTPGTAPGLGPVIAPATLDVEQGCVLGKRAKVVVTAPGADAVTFFLDGRRVKTVTPSSRGRAVISMRCSHLKVGAHRGRAVVGSQTLRFQITRARQGSPRFTG
jgi:hypothetical protein